MKILTIDPVHGIHAQNALTLLGNAQQFGLLPALYYFIARTCLGEEVLGKLVHIGLEDLNLAEMDTHRHLSTRRRIQLVFSPRFPGR